MRGVSLIHMLAPPTCWSSGLTQMYGTAKQYKLLRHVRRSRLPTAGRPRVPVIDTYERCKPARLTHSWSTDSSSSRLMPMSSRSRAALCRNRSRWSSRRKNRPSHTPTTSYVQSDLVMPMSRIEIFASEIGQKAPSMYAHPAAKRSMSERVLINKIYHAGGVRSHGAFEEAEGVPRRIEHDPYVGLRLVFRSPRSELDGVGNTCVQIVDGDVEVHHHLLLTCRRRPHRRLVTGLVLERETGAPFRWLQHHPTVLSWLARSRRLADGDRPSQQPFVERGETSRVRSAEHGCGKGCAGSSHRLIVRHSSTSRSLNRLTRAARGYLTRVGEIRRERRDP